MTHLSRLLVVAASMAVLTQSVTAESNAYSGPVLANDFFLFIEEHSGDAVRLTAEGDIPADQLEKTDDAVFFWRANVQIGVQPNALLQDETIALNGCYRIRLADARAGLMAYFLDSSSDCE
jgi:hypothetical protein